MATYRMMIGEIRPAIVSFAMLTVVTGLAYPLVMTGVGQTLISSKANGSLIVRDGKVVGSDLIGQPFDDPRYFWGRPSATSPYPYNAGSSSGSNLAESNPAQADAIAQRVQKLREADPGNMQAVPIDMVTASGSGLDPHISVEAARYQVPRVARLRGMSAEAVTTLVEAATDARQYGIFGEPVVNVLQLNLALDQAAGAKSSKK